MINPRRYYYSKPKEQQQQQNQSRENHFFNTKNCVSVESHLTSHLIFNNEQEEGEQEQQEVVNSITSLHLNSKSIPILLLDGDTFCILRIVRQCTRTIKSVVSRANPTKSLSIISLCFLFLLSIKINNQSFYNNGSDGSGVSQSSSRKVGRSIYELSTSMVNCESCRGAFKIRNGGKALLTSQQSATSKDGDNMISIIPLVLDKNLGNVLDSYEVTHMTSSSSSLATKFHNGVLVVGGSIKNDEKSVSSSSDVRVDIPIFLHIPRSGGLTVRDVLGSCLKLVLTADLGNKEEYLKYKSLQFLQTQQNALLLNVDTSHQKGIQHANDMKLLEANNNLIDVIVTKDLYSLSSTLLDNTKYQGKVFIMLRDPIERLVSLYHYLGIASWDVNYDPDLQFISLEMFARSSRRDNNNYMVRILSNTMEYEEEAVTEDHLDIAKEVLRKKCIIGLLNHKQESITRYQQYFKWKMNHHPSKFHINNSPEAPTSPSFDQSSFCQEKLVTWGWSNKNHHPNIEETSPAYELLQKKNALDLALFEYAKLLYDEQGEMISTMEKEARLKVRQEDAKRADDALIKKKAQMEMLVKESHDMAEAATSYNKEPAAHTEKNSFYANDVIQDIVKSYISNDH